MRGTLYLSSLIERMQELSRRMNVEEGHVNRYLRGLHGFTGTLENLTYEFHYGRSAMRL